MFFQTINRMITAGTDLSINIRQVNDKLTVAVMPRRAGLKDEAGEQIVPLVLNGTPEELDMEFLGAITAPVQKAQGILTNLETFEKQAEQAVSQSKAAKSVAEKESKEVRKKREKMEKLLKKAEDATGGKRYSEALTWLRQAKRLAMPDKQKEIDVKIAEVQKKTSEGSLFGAEPVMPEPQPAQVIQPVAPQPVPGHAPRYQGGEQIRMFAPEQPSRQSPHQIPRSVQGTRPQQVPHGQAASRPGADGIPAGCQQPVNRPQTIQFYQPVQMPQSQVYDGQWLQPVPSQPQTASTQTVPDNKGESEYGARAQDMGQYGFDKDDEHDRELLREDPYAEYLDFPEEYRMKDEAQMEMICC